MGIIGMFRRPTWIRRWSSDGRHDSKIMLNVQPLSSNDLKALPEGNRQDKRLKAFGDFELTASDQQSQQRGDWMYYRGRWYVCLSCILRDHTAVGHYRSEWVSVSEAERAANLVPPVEPVSKAVEESPEGDEPDDE